MHPRALPLVRSMIVSNRDAPGAVFLGVSSRSSNSERREIASAELQRPIRLADVSASRPRCLEHLEGADYVFRLHVHSALVVGHGLLSLEALRLELQRPTVFRHGPDDLIGSAVRQVRRDLERHSDVGVGDTCQVTNDLVADLPGIGAQA